MQAGFEINNVLINQTFNQGRSWKICLINK